MANYPADSVPLVNNYASPLPAEDRTKHLLAEVHIDRTDNPHGTTAAQTSFTSAGTGAVARTMQDKGRDVLSAKDFGATGSGSTNDTFAISLAMAAANLAATSDYFGDMKPVVFFPPGKYQCTIDVPYGVSIEGASVQSTIFVPPSGAGRSVILALAPTIAPAFQVSNYTRSTFRNFTVNGFSGGVSAGSGIELQATPYSYSSSTYTLGATITDIKILGCHDYGLKIGTNRNWCLVSRVISGGNVIGALQVASFDNRFTDCDFGSGQYNIRIEAGGSNHFVGCNVYYATVVSLVKASFAGSYNWFEGCTFDFITNQSVHATASGGDSDILGFVNCNFSNPSQAGDATYPFIELVNGQHCTVIGGKMRRTASGNRASYLVKGSGTGLAKLAWSGVDYEDTDTTLKPYATGIFNSSVDLQPLQPFFPGVVVQSGTQFTGLVVKAADQTAVGAIQGASATNKGGYLTLFDSSGAVSQRISAAGTGVSFKLTPPSYADNAAALAAGLTTGNIFWNTTTSAFARTA